MWNTSEIKRRGREAFKANYFMCVVAGFILTLLAGGGFAASRGTGGGADVTATGTGTYDYTLDNEQAALLAGALAVGMLVGVGVALLIKIFIKNPVNVGCARFFQDNLDNPSTGLNSILLGFGNYGRTFLTMFLRDLFIALWCCLLIVPGIMKAYSYQMVPYILLDEPDLSPTEVLARSKQMMEGNRWQAFCMDLSFIGWFFLGAITAGLGMALWTTPYYESTHAALYQELKRR